MYFSLNLGFNLFLQHPTETKWTNKFSNNIPITSTLIQKNEENRKLFLAGNDEGQLLVFNEIGRALELKQCRKDTIFALLDLGNNHIVAYYPGGNEEYAMRYPKDMRNGECEMTLELICYCKHSGNYSIHSDFANSQLILQERNKGTYPLER